MVIGRQPHRSFQKPVLIIFLIGFCILNVSAQVRLVHEDGKATQIIFPARLIQGTSEFGVRKKGAQRSILGETIDLGDSIAFRPLLHFEEGMTYEVYSHPGKYKEFTVPERDYPRTRILSIYPSQDTLPENLLKLYITFSAPMAENQAYQNIMLTDDTGMEVKEVFLELTPELWNEDKRVFTLWCDPGRIKRDLIRNQKLGAALQAGKHYTLTISSQWTDKRGNPLQNAWEKQFFIRKADREPPDIGTWRINMPAHNTRDALIIIPGEPLDYSLILGNMVEIYHHDQRITGQTELTEAETLIKFTPDTPWNAGKYQLSVYHTLEDLAGNNLNRPFDRDLEKSEDLSTREYHIRYFTIN